MCCTSYKRRHHACLGCSGEALWDIQPGAVVSDPLIQLQYGCQHLVWMWQLDGIATVNEVG